MAKTWLLLDCNNLCYRAFNTTKHLNYEERPTGVIYGFLRGLSILQQNFNTSRLVFCFDHGQSFREKMGVGYKAQRRAKEKEMPEEEIKTLEDMRSQVDDLKRKHLPGMGFKNIFYYQGYEADDVIGNVCKSKQYKKDQLVIVSNDHDYYQLLSHNTVVYDPIKKQSMTEPLFKKEYGCSPKMWYKVKALAGCVSDNIEGLKGIGEKTACKFFGDGLLEIPESKLSLIREFIPSDQFKLNKLLTKIPYPECPSFHLVKDKCDRQAWIEITSKLGMNSLETQIPIWGK